MSKHKLENSEGFELNNKFDIDGPTGDINIKNENSILGGGYAYIIRFNGSNWAIGETVTLGTNVTTLTQTAIANTIAAKFVLAFNADANVTHARQIAQREVLVFAKDLYEFSFFSASGGSAVFEPVLSEIIGDSQYNAIGHGGGNIIEDTNNSEILNGIRNKITNKLIQEPGDGIPNVSNFNHIGTGLDNLVEQSTFSSVHNGTKNRIIGQEFSTILNGDYCIIDNGIAAGNPSDNIRSNNSILSGGYYSRIVNNNRSTIVGGSGSMIEGDYSQGGNSPSTRYSGVLNTILGGHFNYLRDSSQSQQIGGTYNEMTEAHLSMMVGGYKNEMFTNAEQNMIIGGQESIIQGWAKMCTMINSPWSKIRNVSGTIPRYSNIIGSYVSYIYNSQRSNIFGGRTHYLLETEDSQIIGGARHYIGTSDGATILGGNTTRTPLGSQIIEASHGSQILGTTQWQDGAGAGKPWNIIKGGAVDSTMIMGQNKMVGGVDNLSALGWYNEIRGGNYSVQMTGMSSILYNGYSSFTGGALYSPDGSGNPYGTKVGIGTYETLYAGGNSLHTTKGVFTWGSSIYAKDVITGLIIGNSNDVQNVDRGFVIGEGNTISGGDDIHVIGKGNTSNGFTDVVVLGSGITVDENGRTFINNAKFVGDIKIGAATGVSQALTFGGGGSGDVATMTLTQGIVTAVTLVP